MSCPPLTTAYGPEHATFTTKLLMHALLVLIIVAVAMLKLACIEAFEKAAGLAGEALPDGLRLLAKALHNAVSSSRRFIPPERRRKLHAWIKASTVQAVRLCNAAFLAFKPASGAEEDEVDYSGISQLFQDPAQYSNHFSNLRAEILRIAIINHLRMRALAGLDVHQGHGHDFDGVLHEHRD